MLFEFTCNARWKNDEWNKLFNLVADFKAEYNLKVIDMGSIKSGKYYFKIGGYTFYFENNSQGNWIKFQSDTSKEDFDEKYNFIVSKTDEKHLW